MYRSSPFRGAFNTGYITALDMCSVCTENGFAWLAQYICNVYMKTPCACSEKTLKKTEELDGRMISCHGKKAMKTRLTGRWGPKTKLNWPNASIGPKTCTLWNLWERTWKNRQISLHFQLYFFIFLVFLMIYKFTVCTRLRQFQCYHFPSWVLDPVEFSTSFYPQDGGTLMITNLKIRHRLVLGCLGKNDLHIGSLMGSSNIPTTTTSRQESVLTEA